MQTIKQPYEFLARWDQSGAMSGAHVQHRYLITDGGAVIGETLGQAEPLTLDAAAGMPLADLLTQMQVDALAAKTAADVERDAARVERDGAIAARQAAEQALASITSDLAAARDHAAAMEAERNAALVTASAAQIRTMELERRIAEQEAQLAALRPAVE